MTRAGENYWRILAEQAMELRKDWPLWKRLAEAYEQRLSFAYGNTKLHNPAITRDLMQDVSDQMDGIVRSDT